MLRPIALSAALLAALLASPALYAADDFLRPGQWELRMQLSRDGQKVGKEQVSKRCVTPDSLAKDRQQTFQPFATGCTGQHKQAGKKNIEWSYECSGPPPMKGSGKLTYAKDRYWGESESFADLSGGKSLRLARTQITFKAERIGDCAASPVPAPNRKAPIKKSVPAGPNETRAVVDELRDGIAYVGEREVR